GCPARAPSAVITSQPEVSSEATMASKADHHASGEVSEGISIEFITRKSDLSGGATTSSPGTSAPGLNCSRSVHTPSYSFTCQPGGTATLYPCRVDSKMSGALMDGADVSGVVERDSTGVPVEGGSPWRSRPAR